MDILGCLKNTNKNPKLGKVRQVPTREFPTKFPDWDLSHSSKFGFFWLFFKYPKIGKNGNLLFFPVIRNRDTGNGTKRLEKEQEINKELPLEINFFLDFCLT